MKWIISLFCLLNIALASHEVGNGGDGMRKVFKRAQIFAAARVAAVKDCSFDDRTSSTVIEWILNNKKALEADILSSKHFWVVDDQPTCAFTPREPGAPIYLAYENCFDESHNVEVAGELLVHEAVHHFNISDENFADEVARAIYSSDPSVTCPSEPESDPFNPMSCMGQNLTLEQVARSIESGETQAILTDFKSYARYRKCTKLTGCTDWKNYEISHRDISGTIQKGVVKLDYRQQDRMAIQFLANGNNGSHLIRCSDFTGEDEANCHSNRQNSFFGLNFQTKLKLTNKCIRIYGEGTSHLNSGQVQWTERQAVFFGKL